MGIKPPIFNLPPPVLVGFALFLMIGGWITGLPRLRKRALAGLRSHFLPCQAWFTTDRHGQGNFGHSQQVIGRSREFPPELVALYSFVP